MRHPRPPDVSGIYEIEHAATRRLYVGSSVAIHARWRKHLSDLQLHRHDNGRLQADWLRDPALHHRIVEVCPPSVVRAREAHWIDAERLRGRELYNEASVLDPAAVARREEEVRAMLAPREAEMLASIRERARRRAGPDPLS